MIYFQISNWYITDSEETVETLIKLQYLSYCDAVTNALAECICFVG